MATATAPSPRRQRELTSAERRIHLWICKNKGVLSQVARETGKSVAFVQRVAYFREARSKEFIVERRLKALGCPLIQKIA